MNQTQDERKGVGRAAAAVAAAFLVLTSLVWLLAALLKLNLRSGYCTDSDPSTCQGTVGSPTAELLLALLGIGAALVGAAFAFRHIRPGHGGAKQTIPLLVSLTSFILWAAWVSAY